MQIISFKIALKHKRYLTTFIQNLYFENYETLLREIKETLNK